MAIDYDTTNGSGYVHTVIITYYNRELDVTFDEVAFNCFPTAMAAMAFYKPQVCEWKLRKSGGYEADVRTGSALHKDDHLRAVAMKTYAMLWGG